MSASATKLCDAVDLHIDELLHAQRSARLEMVDHDGGVVLSAGCAGRWYLDWIEEVLGPIERHIGLEYYVPPPPELPPNVEWIANTVSDMTDVADDSVDLVISGQNIEHLWVEDMVGFLCEANRVLHPGGRLVMDSPNRELTRLYNWSHPEHTIELTPTEVRRALELAGFEVDALDGVMLSRDTRGLLPLSEDDETQIPRRVLLAGPRPDDSFCWWVEASPRSAPRTRELRDHLDAVFTLAWPERVQRFVVGDAGEALPGSGDPVSKPGWAGAVMFGPYMPLPRGRYRVTWEIVGLESSVENPGYCDVMVGDEVVSTIDIGAIQTDEVVHRTLEFELHEPMTFGLQFRVLSLGVGGRFRVRRPIQQERVGDPG